MMANCMNRVWNKFRDVAYPLVLLGVAGWTSLGFAQEVGGEGGEPNEPQPVAASVSVLPPDGAVLQDGRYIVSETNGTGFVSVTLSESYQDGDGIVRVHLDVAQPVDGVTNLTLASGEVVIEYPATNALVEFSILDGTAASMAQGVTVTPTILNDASNTFTTAVSGQVYVQNEAPRVTVTSPSGVFVGGTIVCSPGDEIAFHWTVQDLNVDGCTVTWNFGDGNSATENIREGEVTNAYASAGAYIATCTVTDKDGDLTVSRIKVRIPEFPLSAKYVVYTGGGTGALTDGDAWLGGAVPGAENVAVFIDGFEGVLAASQAWSGIRVLGERVQITMAQNVTVSVGADGIMTDSAFKLIGPLSLTADQTIELENKAKLTLTGPVQKNGHHVTVRNQGGLCFGEMGGNRFPFNWDEDDTLDFTGTSSSTEIGWLSLRGMEAVATNDSLRANWLEIRHGTWDQRDGSLVSAYATILGSEDNADGSKLLVNGGTVQAYRFMVGTANSPANPAEMIVSNGVVTAKNTNTEYGGVQMGVAKSPYGGSSGAPDAHLTIAGGKLSTPFIRFGCGYDNTKVSDGYAQVWLKGGELELTGNGIFATDGNAWQSDFRDSSHLSWHDVTFSGGTVTSPENNIIAVRVRVSDGDGGVTAAVPSGWNMAFLKGAYGTGSIRKTGAGNLRFAAASTFTGRLDVAEGTVTLGYRPTAIYRADDLDAEAGETVDVWHSSMEGVPWTFSHEIATKVNKASVSPTIAAETINGHKALRFNGESSALAMSISPGTPAAAKANLTVFAVVRAAQASQEGAGETDWRQIPQIVGAGNTAAISTYWGLCADSNGCAVAGVTAGKTGAVFAAWSDVPFCDGTPHVLGFRWSKGGPVAVANNRLEVEHTAKACSNNLDSTRMLLGMSEAKRFFAGDVAELVFYDRVLTDDAYNLVGGELARKYGANFEPIVAEYELPAPDAVWSADSLAQGAGESVTEWGCSNEGAASDWVFNETVAKVIVNSATPPVISANTFNGHKAVAFNGTSDCLAMTKNVSGNHVFEDVNKLTVAVVFRAPETAGFGKPANGWRSLAGLVGGDNITPNWGVSLAANGRMGMGIRSSASNSGNGAAAWSQPRHLNDGLSHVAIFSYNGDDKKLRSSVDGYCYVGNVAANMSFARQRAIMGMNESKHYFRGEIAEIRIYRNVALDVNQMESLGRELALKYGTDRFIFDGNYGPSLASEKILLAQGAVVETGVGCTTAEGQVWSGAGTVNGQLTVVSNAVVSAMDGSLTVERLTLEPGGILEVPTDAQGAVTTALQVGDLTLPEGEVTLRVNSAVTTPGGVFLRWTGTLYDNGADWQVLGGNSGTCVLVDAVAKELRLQTPTGTIILLR